MYLTKSGRKRASKWDQSSERALLEIWKEKMDELRATRKNRHILQKMVEALRDEGFAHTVVELKTKMHNMTSRYRKEKRQIDATGCSPSDWDLYSEMETLFAPNRDYQSEKLITDSIDHINTSTVSQNNISLSPISIPSSSPSPSPSTKKAVPLSPTTESENSGQDPFSTNGISKKEIMETFLQNIENKFENMQEDLRHMSERILAIEEEKKEILKQYVEKEAEVQNALIEFLKKT